MKVRVRLENADQIARRLAILPSEVAGEHLRQSARAGAEVLRRAAESRARTTFKGQGKRQYKGRALAGLANSIIADVTEVKDVRRVVVSIGPDKGHFYAVWVELGHALVRGRTKATRRVIGHVAPHPFMRPAFDEAQDAAEKAVAAELKRRLKL